MLIVGYTIINGIDRFRADISVSASRRLGVNASGQNLMLYPTTSKQVPSAWPPKWVHFVSGLLCAPDIFRPTVDAVLKRRKREAGDRDAHCWIHNY